VAAAAATAAAAAVVAADGGPAGLGGCAPLADKGFSVPEPRPGVAAGSSHSFRDNFLNFLRRLIKINYADRQSFRIVAQFTLEFGKKLLFFSFC
jgi:hypothetical protein